MKILYKKNTELGIQVKSFCPYVQSCPLINPVICSECFSYYIRFEKLNNTTNKTSYSMDLASYERKLNTLVEKLNKANDKNELSEEELITLLNTARNILTR